MKPRWPAVLGAAILLSACGGAAAPAPASSAPAAAKASAPAASAPAAAAATAGDWAGSIKVARLNELYEAAKKEGELVFGGQTTPDDWKPVAALFEKRFPGIKVTVTATDTSTIGQRMVTESLAKRLSLDTAISAVTSIGPAIQRDLLVAHDLQSAGVDPSQIGVDGKFLWTQDVAVGWVYNTRLVSEADVPKKWEDLLDPKWKGKMNIAKSAAGFDMLRLTMSDEQIHAYLKQLAKNNPVPVAGAAEGLNRVATGQDYFSNATAFDPSRRAADQGAPVGPMPLPSIYTSPQGLFTVKGIQHPNAAELYMLWMGTAEARAALTQAGFGRFNPCGPLPTDKWACGHKWDVFAIDTLEKGVAGGNMRPQFAKDLGFE